MSRNHSKFSLSLFISSERNQIHAKSYKKTALFFPVGKFQFIRKIRFLTPTPYFVPNSISHISPIPSLSTRMLTEVGLNVMLLHSFYYSSHVFSTKLIPSPLPCLPMVSAWFLVFFCLFLPLRSRPVAENHSLLIR